MMKIKEYKNGAYASLDDSGRAYIMVKAYNARGECIDKILCDSRRVAGEYFRAFCKLAKNS